GRHKEVLGVEARLAARPRVLRRELEYASRVRRRAVGVGGVRERLGPCMLDRGAQHARVKPERSEDAGGSRIRQRRDPAEEIAGRDGARRTGREPDRLERLIGERGRRSEEHTSELQSRENLVCRRLPEKKNSNGSL